MLSNKIAEGFHLCDTVNPNYVEIGLLRDQDILLLTMQGACIEWAPSPTQLFIDYVEARKVQLSVYVCLLVSIGLE